MGLLSSMLSDARFGSEIAETYFQADTPQNVGHLFGVLPISSFEDFAHYKQRIGKAIHDLKSVKKRPGVEEIYLPGEREYLLLQERRRTASRSAPRCSRI